MALPLTGVRVLDLGRLFAAPWATQTLADMGAEVIKVERPGAGDEFRVYGPPFVQGPDGKPIGETPYYYSVNRNKKGIAVDISKPEGQTIIRDMARKSDVMVENFKVGDLARYGLDYDSIKAINPGIVYCSVTGFGQTGPYKDRLGIDMVFQAMGGMMSATGEPGRPPQRVGIVFSDLMAGQTAVSAILAALYSRDARGGVGQHIDVALLDATISAMSHRVHQYLLTGEVPPRYGNATPSAVPSRDYQCSDGVIMIQVGNDIHFKRFCGVIGRPELTADPRFLTRPLRSANRDALNAIVEAEIAKRTLAEWLEGFHAAQVIVAPIYNVGSMFADPHIQARGMLVEAEHKAAGPVRYLRNPARFSETPLDVYRASPVLGQHTEEVLRNVLELPQAEIDRLKDSGIVQAVA